MKTAAALASRVVMLLTGLVLAGCATTSVPLLHAPVGTPVTTADFPDSTAAELAVTKTVGLTELATPASLTEAARILASPDVRGVNRVTQATELGKALWQRLYPEMENPFPAGARAALEGGSVLSRFLSLVLPGCALLDPTVTVDAARSRALAAELSDASALNPGSVLPPYLQGLLTLRADGSASDACSFFDEALRRAPGFYPAARQCAALLIGGDAAGAWDRLVLLAALLPTAPERFSTLARAALAAGRAEQAADAAAQALLAAPNEPRFALLRAEALEAQGNWYKALWIADVVLKVKPGVTDAIVMKARLLFEKGENDAEALRLLAAAERDNPGEAAIAHLQGRILLSQGRTEQGVAALERALALTPDHIETLSLLLRVAVEAEDWDGAESWLAAIPEQRRTADDYRGAWRMAMGLAEYPQALVHARALRGKGGGAEAMSMEAAALLAAGRPSEARAVVEEALPLAATAALRSSLFLLRSSAGSDDPLRDLQLALREGPDNREALAAIVDLLAKRGEYRKALEYARHAVELSPGDAQLAGILSDLKKRASAGK